MLFDTHMHTTFSTDSKMRIEEALKRTEELNLGVTITEHMDLKYPREGHFFFDVEKYLKEYSKYRSDRVLLGIELGLRHDCLEENNGVINNNFFDYVIGSIHTVNGLPVYSKERYDEGRTKKDTYEEYLEYMYKCVKMFDCFDSLGHIDYIARYSPYEDQEIYYREFSDYIDEVLKVLIEKDKCIEINAARLNDPRALENMTDIYKRYYELGGRFVTLGSDAHKISEIAENFQYAEKILYVTGLIPVCHKERTRIITKL